MLMYVFQCSLWSEANYKNERRERLIITSRLITQQSKKLIFHCHRGATSSPAAKAKTLSQGREKEREIYANFVKIKEELRGAADEIQAFWKWNRQVWV
jgi:predicted translin family RNA/ssDNA-binding protein